jgi:hypothetical protein
LGGLAAKVERRLAGRAIESWLMIHVSCLLCSVVCVLDPAGDFRLHPAIPISLAVLPASSAARQSEAESWPVVDRPTAPSRGREDVDPTDADDDSDDDDERVEELSLLWSSFLTGEGDHALCTITSRTESGFPRDRRALVLRC